jgi:hypothetical protein
MLLYEAPSGIAIFSFDGTYYLKNSVKVLLFSLMLPSFVFVINKKIEDLLTDFSLVFYLQEFWAHIPQLVSNTAILPFSFLSIFCLISLLFLLPSQT